MGEEFFEDMQPQRQCHGNCLGIQFIITTLIWTALTADQALNPGWRSNHGIAQSSLKLSVTSSLIKGTAILSTLLKSSDLLDGEIENFSLV